MANGADATARPQPPDATADATADAADLARVAELVARAGLPLSTSEIAEMVAGYRYDRGNFERMRAMLEPEDEPAHAVHAARVMRPETSSSSGDGARSDTRAGAASPPSGPAPHAPSPLGHSDDDPEAAR